jgi:hypothetical protein
MSMPGQPQGQFHCPEQPVIAPPSSALMMEASRTMSELWRSFVPLAEWKFSHNWCQPKQTQSWS